MKKTITLSLTILAALCPALVGMTTASARTRHHTRHMNHGSMSETVGATIPIVAGSSTVRRDSVGQVVTDFAPLRSARHGSTLAAPRP